MDTATHETIEDRIAALDDEGLLKLAHDFARRVDYFNAAEGVYYTNETQARDLATVNLWKVRDAIRARDLTFDTTGYML